MNSYRLLLAGLLVGAFFSCARQEADVPVSPGRELFYACLEQPVDAETRVYADENLMVLWHADDRVSIFDRYTYNQEYRFTGETGDNAGAFQKVQTDDFVTGNELPNVYAVYPYQASTRISNAQVLTLTLPSEQVYAVRSFGPGANTMVSATEDNNLLFKNVGGYLVLKLYGEGVYVTSLTLKGNADEPLAGKAVVTAPLEGVPSVEMQTGASREITLTCPEPVALGATAEDYTEFWFVLPPTSFAGGLTVTVTGGKGDRFTKTTERSITITRSEISRMAPLKVSLEPGFDTMPIGNVPDIADGSTVHVRGLVSAVATRAFVMSENDSHILVYTGPGAVTCSLGDSVTVSGTKATYRGVAEITSPELSVSVESSGHALPELDYQDITASFDTFSAGCSVPICFRGTLTKSGTQYNVTVEGAARTGYIYWPVAGFVDESLLGSSILVKGFYQGRYNYTTGAFLDIVATRIEAAGQPDNEIWYTSTDGKIVEPDLSVGKPALTLLSNTYENGKGVLVFEEDLVTIPFGLFSFCKTLESVVFPEGVIVVKNAVFEYCENLVSVRFPSTVTQLGGWLFHDCFNLESVNIPEGVTKIEEATFAQCYKLPSVSLPDGLTEIGHSAFCNCDSFDSIYIPESVVSIEEGAFVECDALKTVTIPSGVTEIAPSLFANCNSLTEVIIPEGVTVIGDQAFWYCGALKSARIPSTVISLGDSAFICTSVESVTVPGGVSEIGQECFAGCGSLSSLVLEEGIQVIGQHAFEGCTSLGEVIIPPTVREIGTMAFIYCDGIYAVYVMPAIPPALGEAAFVSEYDYPLFIPMDFLPDYQEAEGWKDYGNRLKWL
ncbi:MAG: leucine-rich repeat protein [Bacteroidales bacterium]|nr:leucine-rich repeat protein [Bacteroidales bacterium]